MLLFTNPQLTYCINLTPVFREQLKQTVKKELIDKEHIFAVGFLGLNFGELDRT